MICIKKTSNSSGMYSMTRSTLLLAGGLGTRLNGKEKALLPFGDGVLIENSLRVLDDVSDEVIISLRDESQIQHLSSYIKGRKVVFDSIRNAGPLAGILEGFREAKGEYVFVVACDMPFLNTDFINSLFEMAEGHDAVIPIGPNGKKEPLHSVYHRRFLLPLIKECIDAGDRFVLAPVLKLNDVVYLDKNENKSESGESRYFTNINYPEDMDMLNNSGDVQ